MAINIIHSSTITMVYDMVFTISVFILDLLPALQNFAKVHPPSMIWIGTPTHKLILFS